MQPERVSLDLDAKVKFRNNPLYIKAKSRRRRLISTIDNVTFQSACFNTIFDHPNFIRFTYFCILYGGVNFIFAYCLIVIVICIPLLCIEVLLGQYVRTGDLQAWSFTKSLNGISYSHLVINIFMTIKAFIVSTRIVTILHSTLYYLPEWSHCNNEWNDAYCESLKSVYSEITNKNISSIQYLFHRILFISDHFNSTDDTMELFKINDSIYNIFYPILFVFILFIIVELFKKTYVFYVSILSTSFVIIMSIVLMVTGVSMPDAGLGLKKLVIPNNESIYNLDVWFEIVKEILVTYKLGTGNLVIMGNCKKYDSEIQSSIFYLVLLEVLMSLVGSIATAECIGTYLRDDFPNSYIRNENIFFIIITKEFYHFEYPNIMIFFVYLMMLIQQINMQLINAEVIRVILIKKFAYFCQSNAYRIIFRLLMYIIFLFVLIVASIFIDLFLLQKIIINFCFHKAIPIIIFIQIISIVYIYGLKNVNKFHFVLRNYGMNYWMNCSLSLICPTIIICVIINKFNDNFDYNEFLDQKQELSTLSKAVGWYFFTVCVLPVPLIFIIEIIGIIRSNWTTGFFEWFKLCFRSNPGYSHYLKLNISKEK